MIPLLWLRGIMIAGIISVVMSLGYLGYSKIKQIGFDESTAISQKIIDAQQELINTKIKSLETLSTTLVDENRATSIALSSDIANILRKVKVKPLTVVKEGVCVPSPIFTETITTVNQRVNQSMKDNQK